MISNAVVNEDRYWIPPYTPQSTACSDDRSNFTRLTSTIANYYKKYNYIIKTFEDIKTNDSYIISTNRYYIPYSTWYSDDTSSIHYYSSQRPLTPEEIATQRKSRIREIIRDRMFPRVHVRRSLPPTTDVNELRSRETMRRVLGEAKYRQFVKNGFVTVRAASGKIYNIFTGHEMTIVYGDNGVPVERLCIVLQGQFPPTDTLIMRYLLLLNNEELFRKIAIRHNFYQPTVTPVDARSLPEIITDLKSKFVASSTPPTRGGVLEL